MIQPDLFAYTPPQTVQQREIERVTSRIGREVLAFVKRVGVNGTFHAADLHDAVVTVAAPASADRILRLLRQQGAVDYIVVSRSESLYRVTKIGEAT